MRGKKLPPVLLCGFLRRKIDLKWCPCSILPIIQLRFHQIIKKKYWFLGSWTIHKAKHRWFFFRLTLYKDHIPFAEIVMLEKGEEFGQGVFFSPNGVGREDYTWNSTSHFRVVNPMEEKHLLFVCKDSGELIAFLPSLNHTKKKFLKTKMNCW